MATAITRFDWFKFVVLLISWLGLIYTRTQAHLQVMSPSWLLWLIVAHSLSVTIGYVLRGMVQKARSK